MATPSVTELMLAAFTIATNGQPRLFERWVRISHQIGSRLPTSRLRKSVQDVGQLDVIVRAIEDERRGFGLDQPGPHLMAADMLGVLSGLWVATAYEVLRLLKERELLPPGEKPLQLHYHLERVRVPLMKHELQKEDKLRDRILMATVGLHGELSPAGAYDRKDPTRSHAMRHGLTPRGSCSWETYDHRDDSVLWLERRFLSDVMLEIDWSERPGRTDAPNAGD